MLTAATSVFVVNNGPFLLCNPRIINYCANNLLTLHLGSIGVESIRQKWEHFQPRTGRRKAAALCVTSAGLDCWPQTDRLPASLLQGFLPKCAPQKGFHSSPAAAVLLHFSSPFFCSLFSPTLPAALLPPKTPPPPMPSLPVCHGATHIPFPPFLVPPPLLLLYLNKCVCICESEACLRYRGGVAQLDIEHRSPHLPCYSSLLSPSNSASEESESLCPTAPEEIMRCQRRAAAPPPNGD